jgi:hypothetical protein
MVGRVRGTLDEVGSVVDEPVGRRPPGNSNAEEGTPWLVRHWVYLLNAACWALVPARAVVLGLLVGLAPEVDVPPPPHAATASVRAKVATPNRPKGRKARASCARLCFFTAKVHLPHMNGASESLKSSIRTCAIGYL